MTVGGQRHQRGFSAAWDDDSWQKTPVLVGESVQKTNAGVAAADLADEEYDCCFETI